MSDPTRLGFPTNFNIESIGSGDTLGRDRRCAGAYTADSLGKPLRFHCGGQAAQNKDGTWRGLCEGCTGRERDWRQRIADKASQRAETGASSSSRRGRQ